MHREITLVMAIVLCTLILSACSSTPTTEFYALGRLDAQAAVTNSNSSSVIGLRRIDLPEYLERANVVSIDDQNRLNVASYHQWAGDLHQQVSRATEMYLQQLTSFDIWQAPWNNNVRPQYQLAIQIHRMDGELGSDLVLQAEWRLYDVRKESVLLSDRVELGVSSQSSRHADYVASIDQAIMRLADTIAPSLQTVLVP